MEAGREILLSLNPVNEKASIPTLARDYLLSRLGKSRCRYTTVVELLTILAMCLIFHGLTIPSVQSGPHKRRPIPATPGPATQTTNSNVVNIDGEL